MASAAVCRLAGGLAPPAPLRGGEARVYGGLPPARYWTSRGCGRGRRRCGVRCQASGTLAKDGYDAGVAAQAGQHRLAKVCFSFLVRQGFRRFGDGCNGSSEVVEGVCLIGSAKIWFADLEVSFCHLAASVLSFKNM